MTCKAEPFAPLPATAPKGGGTSDSIRLISYPNTGMAISSDLGSGLHPVNKFGYGSRAAQVALGMVYGRKIEYYGPQYASHTIVEGGKIRVKFTHVGQGLAWKHGDRLQGFSLAGDDNHFVWADAVVDGDTVVLSSATVPKPKSCRYDSGPWANFFNKDGLPAIPFRTDP